MTQILIIEDDRLFADALACMLRLEGYEVLTANSAAEGIQLGLESNPDVLIADMSLGPGLPGYEACRRIMAVRTEARAILMTGHQDAVARIQRYCSDFNVVMAKPFHKEDILAMIRLALFDGEPARSTCPPPHFVRENALGGVY
jgi:DNA-binding response OmpR family regulator